MVCTRLGMPRPEGLTQGFRADRSDAIIPAPVLKRSDTLRWMLLVGVLVGETSIALARLRPDRAAPFSGRFSWSMFAGPITARCHHDLAAADALGHPMPLPLPADNQALCALFRADVPARFALVAPWFAPYADSDADVARALDDVLSRYHRYFRRSFTLTSNLRCASPGAPPFHRWARWTAR